MDNIELLEFCLNYMDKNPPLINSNPGPGEFKFCKYCYVEENYSCDKSCKFNNAKLELNVLIDKLKFLNKDFANE